MYVLNTELSCAGETVNPYHCKSLVLLLEWHSILRGFCWHFSFDPSVSSFKHLIYLTSLEIYFASMLQRRVFHKTGVNVTCS